MSPTVSTVLALESAIAGGSISLIRDGDEIASWIGTADVLKAENLLVNIDSLLRDNDVCRRELDLIAVSAGPGSFTGVRIGIATALGFKNGLNTQMSSISALDAIARQVSFAGNSTIAVPVGRNAVCVQDFCGTADGLKSSEPNVIPSQQLTRLINEERNKIFIIHAALYRELENAGNVIDFGSNIAFAVGRACMDKPEVVTEPLFISKTF